MSIISSRRDPLTMASVSRSYQYRKVMKPLLERKRRARINRCLNELKQLITESMQLDEETLTKMEKADILELTVHHLHRQHYAANLQLTYNPNSDSTSNQQRQFDGIEYFWCGFQQCLLEARRFLQHYDDQFNGKLLRAIQQLLPVRPINYWRPW